MSGAALRQTAVGVPKHGRFNPLNNEPFPVACWLWCVCVVCVQCFEKRLEHLGPLESDMAEPHPSHEPHAPPQGWPVATTAEVNYLMEQWAVAATALGLPAQVSELAWDGNYGCIAFQSVHPPQPVAMEP